MLFNKFGIAEPVIFCHILF